MTQKELVMRDAAAAAAAAAAATGIYGAHPADAVAAVGAALHLAIRERGSKSPGPQGRRSLRPSDGWCLSLLEAAQHLQEWRRRRKIDGDDGNASSFG